ncbi:putative gustatory receptor 22b [Drosophila elegans]|uniref:putative gustatory receptor 22b n=1 Tax=Drosophila elegans TaxID=30023 RepID=UPI0007E6809C|nr:putative gustatory receptor 22b [Drosophila elegans]
MFGLRREFCPHLVWFLLKAELYGSWIFGLFPFTFDTRKKQLRCSQWLQFYGLIANYSVLGLLVYMGSRSLKQHKLEVFKRSPLLELLNMVIGVMGVFSAAVIHFMNFWGCKKVQEIGNELIALEYQHFDSLNLKSCPKFNGFVIQKWMVVMGQLICFLTVNYGMPGNKYGVLLVLVSGLMQITLNLNLIHYYVGILFTYRYIWMINEKLLDLVKQFELDSTIDSSGIRKFLALYARLLELNTKLVSAYEYQIILILTSGLAGNIVVIYFSIVFGITMGKTSIFLVIFPQSLIINIWNFWLTIAVCDLTEREGKKTSSILKLFIDIEHKDVKLEKSLNEFSWLCSHRKFRIELFGLFPINYNMGFHMIITSFLYLLYLVQFDYMNL